jgi:hypothetical protein
VPDGLQGLAATVTAEQAAGGDSCSQAQTGVDVNVCVRAKGHDGPHVAHDGDQYLQFEEPHDPA